MRVWLNVGGIVTGITIHGCGYQIPARAIPTEIVSTSSTQRVVPSTGPTVPPRLALAGGPAGLPRYAEPRVLRSLGGTDYFLHPMIGKGAAGQVFLVERVSDRKPYALKVSTHERSARQEALAHAAVVGEVGFPQLIDFFVIDGVAYTLVTLFGRRIEDIRTVSGDMLIALPHHVVGSIALQMIDRLETLHSRGFVHLDMYPNNLAIGYGTPQQTRTLYLFDFGESVRYTDEVGFHLMGMEKTRQFDIRSLAHSVLQLLVPGTPYGEYKRYIENPHRPSLRALCEGLPNAVQRLLEYSHSGLGKYDTPAYEFMRSLMHQLAPQYQGLLLW